MPKLADSPRLDRGRKTLRITRTYRGIGCIRVSAGTNHVVTYRRLLAMFDELYSMPERWHLLASVQRREIAPLELYRFYKTQTLAHARTPSSVAPLEPHMFDWLAAGGRAQRTIEGYAYQFRQLLRHAASGACVRDLYSMLSTYRVHCYNKERPTFRAFNLCRAAVLSYLRHAFRDQRLLWREIADEIRPLPRAARRRQPRHLTVADMLRLLLRFSPKYREVVWTLFTTGMRVTEYTQEGRNRWIVRKDRIHIAGTKTPAAQRDIPRIDFPVPHAIHGRSCGQIVTRVTAGRHETRDFRRSYARLLADAGIPEYRQAVYMGHVPQTMTQYYQAGSAESFLVEDAAQVQALIRETRAKVGT